LLRAGLNPVLVVAEPHGQFGTIRERARQLGVAAHLVASESDLKRWGASQRVRGAVELARPGQTAQGMMP